MQGKVPPGGKSGGERGPEGEAPMTSLTDGAFWLSQVAEVGALAGAAYLSGVLATRAGVKVNYTRKIVHFTVFLFPILTVDLFPFEPTLATTLVSGAILMGLIVGITEPVRRRFSVVAIMFAAVDRPEDRPHTLLWLTTQVLAGYAVLVPLAVIFDRMGLMSLIYIPILINGVGDGLAEPVGVRFGKHRYEVRALTSKRTYTRSLEGSACVLLTGFAVVAAFHDLFTTSQFVAALFLVPALMTLAEARSPHTWDSPFLFLSGGLTLLAIVAWI